ncbi:MAG TPA: cupin domain-containing protein [Candidatus Eisenbacteria bacterium]|nr:cupin domain-containing protein [Candidatus Eisenbacteria bacterium]
MIRTSIALATALLFAGAPALAEEKAKTSDATKAAVTEIAKTATPAAAGQHRTYTPADLKWSDPPPGLPKGAKVAVLQGDPSAPGAFTMRVTLPAGYRVAPHHHPADENLTVLSGELYMGMGDVFDEAKAQALGPGSFSAMPVGVRHYAFTKAETVFQVHAMGPWGIVYVNPQDDPRNAKQVTK